MAGVTAAALLLDAVLAFVADFVAAVFVDAALEAAFLEAEVFFAALFAVLRLAGAFLASPFRSLLVEPALESRMMSGWAAFVAAGLMVQREAAGQRRSDRQGHQEEKRISSTCRKRHEKGIKRLQQRSWRRRAEKI
ncbi:hypothetical protein KR100_05120 [Synechococcus sp. KORDI-100]|nr:hypothetical protein KR100_05120 [Synechococcus sp. KORDI-100]